MARKVAFFAPCALSHNLIIPRLLLLTRARAVDDKKLRGVKDLPHRAVVAARRKHGLLRLFASCLKFSYAGLEPVLGK